MTDTTLLKRLLFQSAHRGTKELDILLGRFAEGKIEKLSNEELQNYAQFLDLDEKSIYDCIMGYISISEFDEIALKIREYSENYLKQ